MWKIIGEPVTVPVTQQLAKEFANMKPVECERDINENKIALYTRLWKENKMRPVHWAKVWVHELQEWFRVNGMHTSNMTQNNDLLQFPTLYATIEAYEADTIEDAVDLYNSFDPKEQARSNRDIIKATASTIPELKQMDPSFLSLMIASLEYERSPGLYSPTRRLRIQERAASLRQNVPFVKWAAEYPFKKRGQATHLRRSGVVAAMIRTWKANADKATEFWIAVRDETGETPDLPDRVLARWLRDHRIASNKDYRRSRSLLTTPHECLYRSISCFNAWCRGVQEFRMRYSPNSSVPEVCI